MPYTLKEFPIITSEAKIDVELPVGEYTFELVVEDSAGLQSLVDTVKIRVIQEAMPQPVITKVEPVYVTRDSTKKTKVIITGKHLGMVSTVRFRQGDHVDPQVTAAIDFSRVSDSEVVVMVTAEDRVSGREPFELELLAQDRSVIWKEGFFVVLKPVITDFNPNLLDRSQETQILVTGENLSIENPLIPNGNRPEVALLRNGQPDPRIKVVVRDSEPERLSVYIDVHNRQANQIQTGEKHTLWVKTVAGEVEASQPLTWKK